MSDPSHRGESGIGTITSQNQWIGEQTASSTILLEEVVRAQAFELEALMNILERRGLITKAAVLEDIKRLRDKAGKAR